MSPIGSYVGGLTLKDRSVCSLGSTGGGCCTWLFHIKQKHLVQQHPFLCSNIQHSTFPHQPKAGGPPFLSRTGNVWHAFHWRSFGSSFIYATKETSSRSLLILVQMSGANLPLILQFYLFYTPSYLPDEGSRVFRSFWSFL